MSRVLVVAAVWLVCVSAVEAQSPAETFLAELQTALRNNDRAAVAARVRYPVTVTIAGLRVPFADSGALLARYDDIFTPALVETIARAGTPALTGEPIVIGNYNLVIQRIGEQWKIIAIAVPPPEPDSTTSETRPRGSPAEGPTRVGIRGGPRPTQFPGALFRGATDIYVLWVPKGRVLEVRLNRVQGRSALIRVVHAKTGAPFNPRITGAARVVTGIAPESADYLIEVRREESGDSAPLPYMVSLSLK